MNHFSVRESTKGTTLWATTPRTSKGKDKPEGQSHFSPAVYFETKISYGWGMYPTDSSATATSPRTSMKAGQLTGFACPDRTVIRSSDESSIRKGAFFHIKPYQLRSSQDNTALPAQYKYPGDGGFHVQRGHLQDHGFLPRFEQYGRIYRPGALSHRRTVGRHAVHPRQLPPGHGVGKDYARGMRGNSHVRYDIRGEYLRLLTNMPLTYLYEERPFALTEKPISP